MINIQDYNPYQYSDPALYSARQVDANSASSVTNTPPASLYMSKAPASSYVSSAPTSLDRAPLDYTGLLSKLGTEQSVNTAVDRINHSDNADSSVLSDEEYKSEPDLYLPSLKNDDSNSDNKTAQEVFEESECQTCKNRKYQDGSDDPGVSFKTPTHIDPSNAGTEVRGHEMEHVTREQAEAEREGRKVISQTVSYHTEICPECGRVYVSGGETRTVTAADNSNIELEDESQTGNSL